MKYVHIGETKIPLDDYATSGTAILGIRDSGKTYGAKGIAEQLIDHGIPPIIFDPIGRWRYLKIAGDDHDRPKGYKIVVAGGESPDLPLTPQSAPEIVRAAIRENIPLVLDLYSRQLSKADWRRIVQSCFRTLLYENKGVRHIFLEEAAEFAPQKIMDGETYAEVEKLVRMGGNVSLGITLINQRSQELNKAVLELCDNLVLMKQRGAHAIDSVQKWLDRLSPDEAAEIAKSLPKMGQGDAWVMTPRTEIPKLTRTDPIRSFHPSRRKPELSDRAAAKRTTDTEDFVTRLSGVLQKVIEEGKANDPRELQKQVADLKRQLQKPVTVPQLDLSEVNKKIIEAFDRGHKHGVEYADALYRRRIKIASDGLDKAISGLAISIDATSVPNYAKTVVYGKGEPLTTNNALIIGTAPSETKLVRIRSQKAAERMFGEPQDIGKGGKRRLMIALAQYPEGLARRRLCMLADMSATSGTTANYLSELRQQGYITGEGEGPYIATHEGIEAVGEFEPLPSGHDLVEYWKQKLGASGKRRIFEAIVHAYPEWVHAEDIGESALISHASGTFANYMSELATLNLIDRNKGEARLSEDFFK